MSGDTNLVDDAFVNQYGPDNGWRIVSGKLAPDIGALPVVATFDFRLPGQTQAVWSWAAEIGADGSFTLPAPVGVYDLSAKVTHWLRKTVALPDTSGGGNVDAGVLVLLNGDVNDDNHVGLMDLSWVMLNWQTNDPMADLDGSGLVGFGDLSIVLLNFGLTGDP